MIPVLLLVLIAADWRQFRGPDSSGISTGAALPKSFSKADNIAWTAELPGRGLSSPIIVGDRVYITASSGAKNDRLHVLAFDAATGRELWRRTFWATGPTDSHPKSCMAAPTPVADGQRVVALFGTNDLVCLDRDGNVLWMRALYEENPGATDGRGLATSPLLVGDTVIVQVENQNVSFVAGIDIATGANRWRKDRPKEQSNWSSPIPLPLTPGPSPPRGAGRGVRGETLVLLQSYTRLSALDPATGQEVWGLDRKCNVIPSSAQAGKMLYVPGFDTGLAAFELQPGGPPRLLWDNLKLNPDTASPLVCDDRIYVLKGAILAIGDAKTGDIIAQVRLKGPFSASPVSDGSLLFCISEEGAAQVLPLGEKEPKPTESKLEETVLATPAIANGALFVRSDKHLWKIASPNMK
jgi:hypothetical protein